MQVTFGISCAVSTKEDHSKRDCLFIAVFSHGDKNKIHARDGEYKPTMLWESFRADRCPTLAGKPKIFLIQVSVPSLLTIFHDNYTFILVRCFDLTVMFDRHVKEINWIVERS